MFAGTRHENPALARSARYLRHYEEMPGHPKKLELNGAPFVTVCLSLIFIW